MGYLIVAFCAGTLLSIVTTPLVRQAATRRGFVDHPDQRKHQRTPVALGGGLALFASLWLTCLAVFSLAYFRGWQLLNGDDVWLLLGLVLAAGITSLAGVVDDAMNLRVRYKMGAQLLAALLVISSGVIIRHVTVAGVTVELGLLSLPLTVFWLVGAINAMNLIDGADGVASCVGMVLCLAVAVMAWIGGNASDAMIMLALAGALFGFLAYNFPPASIYLGDAGSMLIGLMVGTMAISSSVKGAATVVLAVPVAIWAIPIFDSGAAVLRRKLTGRSLFTTDRGHLHHSLMQRGWTSRGTLIFITALTGVTCVAALLSVHFANEWIAIFTLASVLTILCATRVFGHVELELVSKTVRRATSSGWTRNSGNGKRKSYESRVRLQGNHEWEHFWSRLVESAERCDLTSIKMTVHLPSMEEAYFASWHSSSDRGSDRTWSLSTPLVLQEMSVGQLTIKGIGRGDGTLTARSSVVEFLEPLEEQLEWLESSLESREMGLLGTATVVSR